MILKMFGFFVSHVTMNFCDKKHVYSMFLIESREDCGVLDGKWDVS